MSTSFFAHLSGHNGDHVSRLAAARRVHAAGIGIDAVADPDDLGVLQVAAADGDLPLLRFALDAGADIHRRPRDGAALWWALHANRSIRTTNTDHAGCIRELVHRGAIVDDLVIPNSAYRPSAVAPIIEPLSTRCALYAWACRWHDGGAPPLPDLPLSDEDRVFAATLVSTYITTWGLLPLAMIAKEAA